MIRRRFRAGGSPFDLYLLRVLPHQYLLAAALVAVGIVLDFLWVDDAGVRLHALAIRGGLIFGAVLCAVLARVCRRRAAAELLAVVSMLVGVCGFSALAGLYGNYLTDWTTTLFQIVTFVAIFMSLRPPVFAAFLCVAGVLWFWVLPALYQVRLDGHEAFGVSVEYLIFAAMAFEGGRRLRGFWAEQAAKQARLAEEADSLRELASRDGLTALYNFRHFEAVIGPVLRDTARRGAPLCLCLLDLDGFKALNDTEGHLYGNSLLQHVARVIDRIVRAEDLVFRIGGDEFAIILPGVYTATAHRICARIQEVLARGERREGSVTYPIRALTCTIGIAECRAEWRHPEELVEAADQALYTGKARGGNRIVLADEDTEPAETAVHPEV